MFSGVKKTALACWKPVRRYVRMNKDDMDDDSDRNDALLWSRDLEKHFLGEFSFAVVQANQALEDKSQVETGKEATYVGVYDGHGGAEAAHYVSDHLFTHLINFARDINKAMSEDVIRRAISATESGFLTLVSRTHQLRPQMAKVGACCLIGIVWHGTLYIANLGDSRAVIGSLVGPSNEIVAEQLTKEHNACNEEVREELKSKHPDDPSIVVLKQGVWRVKGIIQVSRSIGDVYLKCPDIILDPSFPLSVPEPFRRPVLSAEPCIYTRTLQLKDKFLIFASDGLWEHLTNEEAVAIVHKHPRAGIAKRLIRKALKKVSKNLKITYGKLKSIQKGERRKYHDDITVVVLFLDHNLLSRRIPETANELSVHGFVDAAVPSKFSILQQERT